MPTKNKICIVFRTKASPDVGFGHLRRCMTLANALKKQDVVIHFVINQDPIAVRLLKDNQFQHICVDPSDDGNLQETLNYLETVKARSLVIDTYDIDSTMLENKISLPVVLIEDRLDQPCYADMVLNPAMSSIPNATDAPTYLTGLQYILLDEVFYSSIPLDRKLHRQVNRVLITVGGGDELALSPILIQWTREALPLAKIDVVVGPFFSEEVKAKLQDIVSLDRAVVLHQKLPTLYQLMLECDLAITGGGQTTYELAATGTPAIAIQLVDNQASNLKYLTEKGVLLCAGDVKDIHLREQLSSAIALLANDLEKCTAMSKKGPLVVDGKGAARVASKILALM